jgi:hypothetical protein
VFVILALMVVASAVPLVAGEYALCSTTWHNPNCRIRWGAVERLTSTCCALQDAHRGPNLDSSRDSCFFHRLTPWQQQQPRASDAQWVSKTCTWPIVLLAGCNCVLNT